MRFGSIEGKSGLIVAMLLAALAQLLVASPASAAFNNTTARGTFAGTHNYQATGGSLRTEPNSGNSCAVGTSNTRSLSGIPAGATLLAGYLYWGGSGPTPDSTVTFQGSTVDALQMSTDNFQTFLNNQDYDLDYFGGVADVTHLLHAAGNGNYTFSGLTVATTDNYGGDPDADYCGPAAVVAGWALVVFYSHPDERYRFSRIYDGIQFFRGDSVTTTQSDFRVPDLVDGKVTVVTWEGDPDDASSVSLNGFDEELLFGPNAGNLTTLVTGCDPQDNIYNSTVNTLGGCGASGAYGVDVDTFDVTSLLQEGQTSATLRYSSGNDLVFLAAQVISTTNTPVADLGISKTHVGDGFPAGGTGTFEITVVNEGPEIATGTTTVTDTLPAGMTYDSASGTGWSCSAVGQVVTCTNSQTTLAVGNTLPTLSLTVDVSPTAPVSLENTATVSHPMFDGTGGNQTDTDTVPILYPDLTTSAKTFAVLSGGDAEPGDIVRYTITLNETGGTAASNISVTDDIPANLTGFSVVSIPAGSTDASTSGGGANGTGYLNVTGISIPANGSVTIVFDVAIGAGVTAGTQINNTANVNNPAGDDPELVAQPIIVSQSQVPQSGTKVLYLQTNNDMTRVPQVSGGTITINENSSQTWTLSPALQKQLVLTGGSTVSVVLRTRRGGSGGGNTARSMYVQLLRNGVQVGSNSNVHNFTSATWSERTFNITVPGGAAARTFNAGQSFELRIYNSSSGGGTRSVEFDPFASGDRATMSFDTSTVINVDSVLAYNTAYPGVGTQGQYTTGDTARIRAVISDPFGSADITAARITIRDALGIIRVNDAAMTQVADSGAATRTYEYPYAIPAGAQQGYWTATVTGLEGTEGTVTHSANGSFMVGIPQLQVAKSHVGDFTVGMQGSFSLVVSNSGAAVAGVTTVSDTLPAGLSFVSGTGTGWSCGAAGQVVTCTAAGGVPASGVLPTLILTVSVDVGAPAILANTAMVANPDVNSGVPQPGNTDTVNVITPDVSTSTKAVVDTNAGDANPGDTLRYTVSIKETAGGVATNVSVADDMPAGVQGFTVVSVPAGATDNSTPNGGANGTGQLAVSGITVPANGTVSVVYDLVISGSLEPGDTIDNTATITNPNGPGASPIGTPTIVVSASQVAAAGNKNLYVYDGLTLSRTPQPTANTTGAAVAANGSTNWTLDPGLEKALDIPAGDVAVTLYMSCTSSFLCGFLAPNVNVQLLAGGNVLGTSAGQSFNNQGLEQKTFLIEIASSTSVPAGTPLVLRVNNTGWGGANVAQYYNGRSMVRFYTGTVINVDSIEVFSAAYPSEDQDPFLVHGQTAYIRAVVSDPFGSYDINRAAINIVEAGGNLRVTDAQMTQVADSGAATKTYEYPYEIPQDGVIGFWAPRVTGFEGTENEVYHTVNGSMEVQGTVTLGKAWAGANEGDAVSLAITGGTTSVAGASTAPATTTVATATSTAGNTLTLSEAFTSGSAGQYTIKLACERVSDGEPVTVNGNGLSRTIDMPAASSVTCTYSNARTVPLSIIKLAVVHSDPINGTVNPKAIPGALVDYSIAVSNWASNPIDEDAVFLTDAVPEHTVLFVGGAGGGGSGPVEFADGDPPSGLSFNFESLASTTDDVEFSADGGATWTYVPAPDAMGLDPAVTDIRINPKGVFQADGAAFTVELRVRVN